MFGNTSLSKIRFLGVGIALLWSGQIVLVSDPRSEKPQFKEAHEGQAIIDQVFRLFIGQVVQRLGHQELEYQHQIEWRTSALALIGIR